MGDFDRISEALLAMLSPEAYVRSYRPEFEVIQTVLRSSWLVREPCGREICVFSVDIEDAYRVAAARLWGLRARVSAATETKDGREFSTEAGVCSDSLGLDADTNEDDMS